MVICIIACYVLEDFNTFFHHLNSFLIADCAPRIIWREILMGGIIFCRLQNRFTFFCFDVGVRFQIVQENISLV